MYDIEVYENAII